MGVGALSLEDDVLLSSSNDVVLDPESTYSKDGKSSKSAWLAGGGDAPSFSGSLS